MDRDVQVSGWTDRWLSRTLPALEYETLGASYVFSGLMLAVGLHCLWHSRRARKTLEQNPSDRAVILARADQHMRKSMQRQHVLTWCLLMHSLVIWATDAGIGIMSIYFDATTNPASYTTNTWLSLAFYCAALLVLYTAILVIVPLVQFIGAAFLIRHFHSNATFASLVPQLRIMATQSAYLWLYIGFGIVSWWSVLDMSLLRISLIEAVFGSGLAWMHASSILNFHDEQLCHLSIDSTTGLKGGVALYGKQVYAMLFDKTGDVLPRYEALSQSEQQITDEKSSL